MVHAWIHTPTRYNKDVWIRLNEDGYCYNYVCTHVDHDLIIVGKDPKATMEMTQAIYAVNFIGPPDYYLGNDCRGPWLVVHWTQEISDGSNKMSGMHGWIFDEVFKLDGDWQPASLCIKDTMLYTNYDRYNAMQYKQTYI